MNKTHIATMGERFFMSKIAIATDSNSGITQAQGRELGIFVMPMPFYINDELFLEDITLSQEQFYHPARPRRRAGAVGPDSEGL